MVWLVDIVFPMVLQSPSSPSSPSSSRGVSGLSLMVGCICICISQVLAELLKGQPYKSPISNCSMSSAIVPRFGVCSWDESLVGAVSRWPFLQSLILFFFFFFPVFPLDRTTLAKNF